MKNLEKEVFHWFGFHEIKNANNTSLDEIKRFTFAPFVPFYLYPIVRKGWDFLVIQLLYKLVFFFYLFLSYIHSNSFWQTFTGLMSKTKISQKEIEMMKNVKNLDSAFGPIGRWRFLGFTKPIAIINIVLFLIGFLALMVFAGIYSRQLSWNRNRWHSMDEFIQSENKWNIVGFLCMVLFVIVYIFKLYQIITIK